MKLKRDMKYLFFIGSGRTGSTLVGQLINYHPNCLISNENRFLDALFHEKEAPEVNFKRMLVSAMAQFQSGLENAPHFKKNLSRYQSRWKDMSYLAQDEDFHKKEIKVIGDKKAGGTTGLYRKSPEKFMRIVEQLETEHQMCFLQVVRNPAIAARSYMASHKVPTFNEACQKVIDDTVTAARIQGHVSFYHSLHYEDLLGNPTAELTKLLSWLNLETPQPWFSKIQHVVDANDRKACRDDLLESASLIDKAGGSLLERYVHF